MSNPNHDERGRFSSSNVAHLTRLALARDTINRAGAQKTGDRTTDRTLSRNAKENRAHGGGENRFGVNREEKAAFARIKTAALK